MNNLLCDIISRVQDIRELYNRDVELVTALKNKLDDVTKAHKEDRDMMGELRVQLTKLEEQNIELACRVENANHDKLTADAKLMDALKRITELEAENHRMIEENKAFLKVSQIVAYEKENAKLRKEIEHLKRQGKSETVPYEEIKTVDQGQETHEEHEEDEEQEPELNVFSVYEKKIKGIVYYVSDDADMRIFAQTLDGEIGEEVGRYQLDQSSGKNKPVFFTPQSSSS